MLKAFGTALSVLLFAGSIASTAAATSASQSTARAFTEYDALKEASKYDMMCNEPGTATAERISISFKYSYDTATDPVREQGYFIVTCGSGAYNETSVLLQEDNYGKVLRPVSLAFPVINSKNEIVGFSASILTGALSFDPKTNQLSTFSKGRGIGDLYVAGIYQLFETEVILREYTIDNQEGEQEVAPIYRATATIDR